MAITTLFVDIGGVLLTNGWDHDARKLAAETFKLDYAEIEERHHLTYDTYEEGKLSLGDYLRRTVFYEKRPFSVDDFKTFMFQQSQPLPGMLDLLAQVKRANGLKVAAVNNEGREVQLYRIQTFGLASVIDFFVSSCFVHFRKPDADIFRVALDIAQVEPQNVVYLEDRPMFVEVATSLSINGVVHEDVETTRKVLAEFGLIVP
jgi:putative hydrolase of the HAD superfamily